MIVCEAFSTVLSSGFASAVKIREFCSLAYSGADSADSANSADSADRKVQTVQTVQTVLLLLTTKAAHVRIIYIYMHLIN